MEELQAQIMQFAPYLSELKRRLYALLIIFGVVFFTAFAAAGFLVSIPLKLFHLPNVVISVSSPFQYITLSMDVALFFACLITLPLLVFQLYKFLKSGLTAREQKMFKKLIPLMVLLFLTGFFYGIAAMYVTFSEMAKINTSIGLINMWDVGKFFSQMILTSTFLGILFQIPIILTALIRLGFIEVKYLINKQRHAIVVIFVFVCLLPPTDALSITLMAVPLILMYYLTIFFNRGYRPEILQKTNQSFQKINQLNKGKIYV